MEVLGIDISTHTGFSLQNVVHGKIQHTTSEISFPKLKGMPRIHAFSNWVAETLNQHHPKLVVFEGYSYNSFGSSMSVLIEIGTVMRLMCYLNKTPYIEVTPTSLKKFATGKGTSKKDEVMMQVYKRWGFEGKTNNESDAYVLGRIGLMMQGVVIPTNEYERTLKNLLNKEN